MCALCGRVVLLQIPGACLAVLEFRLRVLASVEPTRGFAVGELDAARSLPEARAHVGVALDDPPFGFVFPLPRDYVLVFDV